MALFIATVSAVEKDGIDSDGFESLGHDRSGMASPEPITVDPIVPSRPTMPVLYLSTAGQFPLTEARLKPFTDVKICPDDFPSGWTVRCDVLSRESVIFQVMGEVYKKEYRPPYYLSGNWRNQVGDFTKEGHDFISKSHRLRIACRVQTRMPVWVDFNIGC